MTASVACHWVGVVMGKPLAKFQTSKSRTERLTETYRQGDRHNKATILFFFISYFFFQLMSKKINIKTF